MLLARGRSFLRDPSLTIVQQPSNQTAVDGYAAFFVVAESSPASAISYQWQRSKDGGSSWSDVAGETSATIELYSRSALFDDGDRYRVIVGTGGSTTITSEVAILSVPSTGVIEISQTATSIGYSITNTTSLDGAFGVSFYIQRLDSGSWVGWPRGTVGSFSDTSGLLWSAVSSLLRSPSGYQIRSYTKPFPEGIGAVPTESVSGYQRLASGDTCRFVMVVDEGMLSEQTYYSDTFVNGSVIYITQQPQDGTSSGNDVTFSVTASSSDGSTLSYEWQQLTTVSFPGEVWTQRSLPASAYWRDVTYGGGLFVALAEHAGGPTGMQIAATSADGKTWTSRVLPANAFWISVAYGNGVFVAIASESNIAATSSNGITWTQRTLPSTKVWSKVTYGNGVFVAVSQDVGSNAPATSPDGITWTLGGLVLPGMKDIAYGNGIFTAIGSSGSTPKLFTSSDGLIWTERSLPTLPFPSLGYLGFGNGFFFITIESFPTLLVSADGIAWTTVNLPSGNWINSQRLSKVVYGDGLFLTATAGLSFTSPDGTNWTERASLSSVNWSDVAYGAGVFVAVSAAGAPANTLATSEYALSFVRINGETASTFTRSSLNAANGSRYRVIVDSITATPVTSNEVTLTTA